MSAISDLAPSPVAAAVDPLIVLRPATPAHTQAEICRHCGVRSRTLFGSLDDNALEAMRYRIEDMRFKPMQVLYEADTQGRQLYSLRAGVVMLERQTPQGERRILRLAGVGDLIGMEALLGQTHASRAIAMTDVAACALPTAMVQELSIDHRELTNDLMRRWQRALDEADEWLAELSTGPARERVLRLVLKFTEYFGGCRIQLPLRDDIGAMLGMTLETASRVVSTLRREGLLTPHGSTEATVDVSGVLAALRREE